MREDRDPYMRVGVATSEPGRKPDAEEVRSTAARARDEFWRVVTDAFPRPDGSLSLDCINRFRDASDATVREWVERNWLAAPADPLPPGVRHNEPRGR